MSETMDKLASLIENEHKNIENIEDMLTSINKAQNSLRESYLSLHDTLSLNLRLVNILTLFEDWRTEQDNKYILLKAEYEKLQMELINQRRANRFWVNKLDNKTSQASISSILYKYDVSKFFSCHYATDTCPICREEYTHRCKLKMFPQCKHIFCKKCFINIRKNEHHKLSCPLCRKPDYEHYCIDFDYIQDLQD